MTTVIIAIIIRIAIILVILACLKELIETHQYIVIFVIIVIMCLVFGEWAIAFQVAVGFIAIRLGWDVYLKILENQFRQWMNKHYSMLGKTSASKILESDAQIKIPDQFTRYTYSGRKSYQYIVTSFLDFKQKALESEVKDAIYDELHRTGMLDDADVRAYISSAFNRATRTRDLSVMCSESIDLLIIERKLDRPIPGEKVLHCVGVTVGTNFESEELII